MAKVLSKTQFTASEIKSIRYALHLAIIDTKRKLEKYCCVPDLRYQSGDIKYKVDPQFRGAAASCKRNIKAFEQIQRKIEINMEV